MVKIIGDQIKVTYEDKTGYKTQAYVDATNLVGENKHTGEPLKLQWSDEKDIYIQIDDWEWEFNMYTDTYTRKDDPSINNWDMTSQEED